MSDKSTTLLLLPNGAIKIKFFKIYITHRTASVYIKLYYAHDIKVYFCSCVSLSINTLNISFILMTMKSEEILQTTHP